MPVPRVRLLEGDCLDVLRTLGCECVDSLVTDPPAAISFMGAKFDTFKGRGAFVDWLTPRLAECLRVCRPGAVGLVWALPRTSHWTALAIEDAGWIVEDRIAHLFGTGFPKYKTKLKPACEDWWLCRKPGPPWLGVEECKVNPAGRWPANLVLDEEVGRLLDEQAGERGDWMPRGAQSGKRTSGNVYGAHKESPFQSYGDKGGPSRFYYCAKASKKDRGPGNKHPTVKSTALMSWLVKLACPEGGLVLDPFGGTFSTGVACLQTGRRFVGIESDPEYFATGKARMEAARATYPGAVT
jgi:DNA modification methylase